MEGFKPLLIIAVVTLAFAWLATSLVSLLSGGESDSFLGTWSDMFSGLFRPSWWNIFPTQGSNQIDTQLNYAEPLPDALAPPRFAVGDRIRVLLLPFDEEECVSSERRELYRRCAGNVLRVEAIDEFGSLELHVLDDGSQSPDRLHNVLYLDPKYAEPAQTALSDPNTGTN